MASGRAPTAKGPAASASLLETAAQLERVRSAKERTAAELEAVSAAVGESRAAARLAGRKAVIENTSAALAAAEEAKELLRRAVERETELLHQVECEGEALAELTGTLEHEASEHRTAQTRRLKAIIEARAVERDAQLLDALSELYLSSRLTLGVT